MAEIELVQLDLDKTYRQAALNWFLAQHGPCEILRDPPTLEGAIASLAQLIVDATAQSSKLCSRLELLEQIDTEQGNAALYAPVLFESNNKVTKADRLRLAFQTLALSQVTGTVPCTGKIIYGTSPKIMQVRLGSLIEEVRRIIASVEADSAEIAAPTLTLNRHCSACEFRKGCQAEAEKTDDLSLLRCLSAKEIHKQWQRGVTTLTQFSHSYRPGQSITQKPTQWLGIGWLLTVDLQNHVTNLQSGLAARLPGRDRTDFNRFLNNLHFDPDR